MTYQTLCNVLARTLPDHEKSNIQAGEHSESSVLQVYACPEDELTSCISHQGVTTSSTFPSGRQEKARLLALMGRYTGLVEIETHDASASRSTSMLEVARRPQSRCRKKQRISPGRKNGSRKKNQVTWHDLLVTPKRGSLCDSQKMCRVAATDSHMQFRTPLSVRPSDRPTVRPFDRPTVRPAVRPSVRPSVRSSARRQSDHSTVRRAVRRSVRPSDSPTIRPSVRPSDRPRIG